MNEPKLPDKSYFIYSSEILEEKTWKLSELLVKVLEFRDDILKESERKYPGLKVVLSDDDITIRTTCDDYRSDTNYVTTFIQLNCSKQVPNPNYLIELKNYVEELEKLNNG